MRDCYDNIYFRDWKKSAKPCLLIVLELGLAVFVSVGLSVLQDGLSCLKTVLSPTRIDMKDE